MEITMKPPEDFYKDYLPEQTILERAHDIVFARSEEKVREYGDFGDSMIKVAQMASIMSGKELTADDAYNVMIALKLVRESNAHKEDNLLDAVAYIAQANEHRNRK